MNRTFRCPGFPGTVFRSGAGGFGGLLALLMPGMLAAQAPRIELTAVPPLGSTQDLAGLVANAVPANHRVAVYIYVGGWWNKPSHGAPQSVIQADGTWTSDITTGGADVAATRVAAFLIPATWSPPLLSGAAVLPPELDANSLAKVITERTSPNAFHFSGYDWDVKSSCGFAFGPGPNIFSDAAQNVWLDALGRLHLRITHRDGKWQCAEVILRRSLGHGTYRFFLDSAVDGLDPSVVLGLFTWSDDPAHTHREIDIEMSRWGNPADANNAQYVIQPFDAAGHLTRWLVPPGLDTSTHGFRWEPAKVVFHSHQGHYAPPPASSPQLATWTFDAAGVPPAGDERVHLNLWLYNAAAPTNGQECEVVVSRFVFVPLQPEAPKVTGMSRDAQGGFRLQLTGIPQLSYRLEASANLTDWEPVVTQWMPEAMLEFTDPTASNHSRRFYRVAVPEQ